MDSNDIFYHIDDLLKSENGTLDDMDILSISEGDIDAVLGQTLPQSHFVDQNFNQPSSPQTVNVNSEWKEEIFWSYDTPGKWDTSFTDSLQIIPDNQNLQ